jgi:peroxiredoxin
VTGYSDISFGKILNMKKIIPSSVLFGALALVAFTVKELPIGSTLPKAEVKLKDVSGKEISLKDAAKQNGLLVMFSCNTCPYVIKNQERTLAVGAHALRNKVGVVLVNSNEAQRSDEDSYSAMQQYAKDQGYRWYYVEDKNSQVADAFGATRTPETFLFNAEGKLVYHGAIDDNPNDASSVGRKHLTEAITEMVGGKDVAVKTSRSVGCGIKRL